MDSNAKDLQNPVIWGLWFNGANFCFVVIPLTALFLICICFANAGWASFVEAFSIIKFVGQMMGAILLASCFFVVFGNGFCYWLTQKAYRDKWPTKV